MGDRAGVCCARWDNPVVHILIGLGGRAAGLEGDLG